MKISIIRKIVCIFVLTLFILGNLQICEILQGDLSSSILFGKIPLSDPFAIIQIYLASFSVGFDAFLGGFIIFIFYSLIAPRAFCGWICPVNLITDFAHFIRVKFGFTNCKNFLNLNKNFRYFLLFFSLFFSFIFSFLAFENVSFIGIIQRGIIFLNSFVILPILAIFVFELFICERGICGKICPLGAFYAVIGKFSLIRVKHDFKKCQKCNKCKIVCPENQVLKFVGKKDFFVKTECISCGKCIEICEDKALKFSIFKRMKDEKNFGIN